MALAAGARLGPYEIEGPLGSGGMGEVYRARDVRLDRRVAIKVLPVRLAADERFRQRFEREARALASLSHPHICTLHDIGDESGVSFLVMECLEGETLASRLSRGPLPLAEVLRFGVQIADALDQAHRRGVIHRDLKPANVMLTREGVKLLDFGLARESVHLAGAPGDDVAALPTASQPLTTEGSIVGTLHYMAPEQLEGREADARSDLFAFGAVLHEMATGRRVFAGASQASVIAKILEGEPPPLRSEAPGAPAALERLVGRCLAKNPEARWHCARDLALELAWIAENDTGAEAEGPADDRRGPRRQWERAAWAAAVVALAAGLALALVLLRRPEAPPRAARFTVSLGDGVASASPRVSPDGRYLSFTAAAPGAAWQIWLRPLDSLEARPLPGTEGADLHFWSPDSRHLGFLADGKLKRIDVRGGALRTLCDAPGAGPFRRGAWGADGTIVFGVQEAPGHPEGMFRVAAGGGEPVPVEAVDPGGRAMEVVWPSFLPDGRHFLALCQPRPSAGADEAMTCLVSLATGEARPILDVASYSEYAPSGHLLYVHGTSLFAQPFDLGELRVAGEPVRLADGLESWGTVGPPRFSVSETGVLAYTGGAGLSRLVWRDRSGRRLGQVGGAAMYEDVRLGPDGRRAALTVREPGEGLSHLWLLDLEREVATRFTTESPEAMAAVWSPDASRLAYCRPVDAPPFLHVKPLAGGGEEVLLPSTGSMQCPADWSPDGRLLLFMWRHPDTSWDIWALPVDGDGEAAPVVRSAFRELWPALSPDGSWLAYVSDESGQSEVYLRPFPGPGERTRVSTDGGDHPRWRHDGGELYYEGDDDRLMAVAVELGPRLVLGTPSVLFELGDGGAGGFGTRYDVVAGGERFLVLEGETGATPGATVVLDWMATLVRSH